MSISTKCSGRSAQAQLCILVERVSIIRTYTRQAFQILPRRSLQKSRMTFTRTSLLCQAMLAWWRYQMETFSVLLALCEGYSPVNSPHKRQWRGALMFSLNKRLSKQSWGWWFETPSRSLWRHCNGHQGIWYRHSCYRVLQTKHSKWTTNTVVCRFQILNLRGEFPSISQKRGALSNEKGHSIQMLY